MANQRAKPTLQDVAARANVSTATVSRAINSPGKVAESTRNIVAKAVAELGFSPDFAARTMAAKRSQTIGAIIPTMENAIFARGLQAFQDELRNHGFTMLVASTAYRIDSEEEQIRALVARGADALLLIGYHRNPDIYRFLETQQVPVLMTWAYDATNPQPSIGFDNAAAMKDMAKRVIDMGHRRLAMISAQTASNDRAQQRHAGILDAMKDADLPPDSLQYVETTYGIEEGAVAFEQVMAADPRPTAVLCGNDVLAVGALMQARKMGLRVPEDVSVTGFDDIELAQVAVPGLTTVHVPHREMGRLAAKALIAHLTEGKALASVELQTRPVLRDTLAARTD
ncbi:MAG: LacI family DNA-binding transcriptional regulator [Yoonia sp.]|uniref:LacI family DNA-binding transcriptional regulator n=1 Tax=Yoonia sp. TaxID=2212373 RepID=UPI003EF4285C